jgi:catechol 2,3-dioxygenase-like lactoylglutathione lyase family enzyme
MQTTQLLHFAFRARDPERLAHFYAELFEGQFLLHPVMTGLGIMLVKLNHPEALFWGMLEFWPWDLVWDSSASVFRRAEPAPSSTSYGHVAVQVNGSNEQVLAELTKRGIPHRWEPREPQLGLYVITVDDPEGNMIELFTDKVHVNLPPAALCPPERAKEAIAALKQAFAAKTAHIPREAGYPLAM